MPSPLKGRFRRQLIAARLACAWGLPLSVMLIAVPCVAHAADAAVTRDVQHLHALAAAGRYAEEERLATALLTRLRQVPRPDSLAMADAFFAIAEARKEQGKIADDVAWTSAQSAMGIRARHLGPDAVATATAEVMLAENLYYVDLDRGVSLLRHAEGVFMRQPAPDDTAIANAAVDLGQFEVARGNPQAALDALDRALALRTRLFGPDDRRLITILIATGQAQEMLGDYEGMRASGGRALRILDRSAPPDDKRRIGPLSILISADAALGDWPSAIERTQECVRIAEAARDTLDWVLSAVSLGAVLMQAGDDYGAREVEAPVLPLAQRYTGNLQWVAVTANQSMGEIQARLLENDAALTLFRRAETLARRMTTPNRDQMTSMCVLGQSGVLQVQRHYAEALRLGRIGTVMNDSSATRDRTTLVTSRTRGIQMLESVHDTTGIDSTRNELASVRERFGLAGTPLDPIIDYWLARADHMLGRDAAAWSLALVADQGIREQLALNVERMSDARALDFARRKPYVLSQVLNLAGRDPARWETAWDRLVRTRGLVRAELMRRRMPPGLRGDTVLVARHDAWILAQRRLARRLVQGTPAPTDSAGRAALRTLRDDADRAEAAYARALGGRGAGPMPIDVGLPEVRAALPSGGALVAFAEIEGYDDVLRMVAFVTRAGESRVSRIELGRSDSLRATIEAWRERIAISPGAGASAGHRAERECRTLGERVRARVWDPLVSLLAGASQVAVVPDGPLVDLPFHALPVGHDAYLVEQGPQLRVLDAERELLIAPRTAPVAALLAVGNPDYARADIGGAGEPIAAVTEVSPGGSVRRSVDLCSDAPPVSFPPLPATGVEAKDIAAIWDQSGDRSSVVLLGTNATEARVKELAPGSAIVHLATHGVVVGDRCRTTAEATGQRGVGGVEPLTKKAGRKSGAGAPPVAATPNPSPWMSRRVWLALASADHAQEASDDDNDGLLTAEEVVTMNLGATDWVVLSACQSGVSSAWTREGALGMRRAFALAGARGVIASQWSVDDAATAEWMRTLYQVRAAGKTGASVAIEATDREVLAERRRAHRSTHPFYWAAFGASGE